jgi:hypothetical protein
MVYTGVTNHQGDKMQTLSFNVSTDERTQAVDAARDAVMTLHSAGVEVGMHNIKAVGPGVFNVHVRFNAEGALGPHVMRAFRSIRALANVDAVNTF